MLFVGERCFVGRRVVTRVQYSDRAPIIGGSCMKLLRLQQVIEMTGLSRSTIYRYEGSAVFPKRRKTGPNTVRWLEDDVVRWMTSRPSASISHGEENAEASE